MRLVGRNEANFSLYLERLGTAVTVVEYCELPRYVLRTESYNLVIAQIIYAKFWNYINFNTQ